MLEELEITKDNLSKDIFLSLLANVSEQYNILLKKETITLDDTTKILSQIMEAYSFFNTIQQSELTQELSDARIQLNQIAITFQNLEQFKGEKGDKGDTGNDGADGTPFTFDMFTLEQLELLRGIQGERGEKGLDGTMTFEDLTPEQIALLKGEKGDNGINGTPFTFDMFTPEQLALLKGAKGDNGLDGIDGQNGNDFTFDMFTPEQLALLKGAKGDTGEAGITPNAVTYGTRTRFGGGVDDTINTLQVDGSAAIGILKQRVGIQSGVASTLTIAVPSSSAGTVCINAFYNGNQAHTWTLPWIYYTDLAKSVGTPLSSGNATLISSAVMNNGGFLQINLAHASVFLTYSLQVTY